MMRTFCVMRVAAFRRRAVRFADAAPSSSAIKAAAALASTWGKLRSRDCDKRIAAHKAHRSFPHVCSACEALRTADRKGRANNTTQKAAAKRDIHFLQRSAFFGKDEVVSRNRAK